MAVKEILLLGNPLLYQVCAPVEAHELGFTRQVQQDLHDTMMAFRARHGWGRAIAAPQIGVLKRIVYLHIERPQLFINPRLSKLSPEWIELWDDCMSFPDLLVRVRRHRSARLTYLDENWQTQAIWLENDLSELLQHEIDHLDGILAVMRSIDGTSFALQSQRHLLDTPGFANQGELDL
jgi:peptide deformylase